MEFLRPLIATDEVSPYALLPLDARVAITKNDLALDRRVRRVGSGPIAAVTFKTAIDDPALQRAPPVGAHAKTGRISRAGERDVRVPLYAAVKARRMRTMAGSKIKSCAAHHRMWTDDTHCPPQKAAGVA